MPIQIRFLAQVSNFLKGTTSVEKALDEVADSLDDVAKDSARSADDMADDFKDAAKDVDKATDKLERGFKDLADSAKKAGNDAGDGIAKGVKAGTKKAEAGLDDLKSESGSTARESAASFSGEWTDAAGALQEVAANALAGFGPAGAAAGLVAAAGIGIATAAIENGIVSAEQYQEQVQKLAEEFIETGRLGETSLDFLVDVLKDMATATEDGQTNLRQLKKLSDTAETSFKDLATAYGNNVDALKEQWRESDKLEQSLTDQAAAVDINSAAQEGLYGDLLRQADAQGKITDYLGQQIGVAGQAAEAQRLYAEAGGPELELKAQLIGQVNEAYDDSAADLETYLNKETGLFDTQAYITAMSERELALEQYQDTLAKSGLSPEAQAFLNEQGQEAAASFLAGYQAATPTQKTQLNRIWSEAGRENSGQYQGALKKALPNKLDKKVKVEAAADTYQAERDLNRLANKTRYTTIIAEVVDKYGRPVR
jgi:polyhydroxyalkanoate synthesis regulator phasin